MQDAWRAYLELALGLTEASRRKAEKVAKDLLNRGGATAGQVQSLVEDLVSTSRANREELAKLVRYEVDRALGAVGLATAEEFAQLTSRITQLERRLGEPAATQAAGGAGAAAGAGPTVAKQTVAKQTVAKQTVAKTTAKKTTAKKATAKKVAKTTAAKRAPAKATKQTGARKATG